MTRDHKGGYGRFRFDATAAPKPGPGHVIAVQVNDADVSGVAPSRGTFTRLGGLYCNSLYASDPLSVRMMDYPAPGVSLESADQQPASTRALARGCLTNDHPAGSRSHRIRAATTTPAR